MTNACIVSVAFREPYVTHSKRQEALINVDGSAPTLYFHNRLPMKDKIYEKNIAVIVEKFQQSLYGFKPHAIQIAINEGCEKIIWLDPSVLPTGSLDILINALDEHPIITITGDATMDKMCNDKALKYFGVTREEAKGIRHVGGTIYGFNFNHPKAVEVFELWKKAEEDGIFGTQTDFMNQHWADEACMALALYKCGVKQYFPEGFTYLNQKEI